jgi:hypothetical protein
MNLIKLREDINKVLEEKRKQCNLTFIEEEHKYFMSDLDGVIKSDWPSVSKVIKNFYTPFDSDGIAHKKAKGDIEEKNRLLKEWEDAGKYSTNLGSRTHFLLEKISLEMFNIEKQVRQPEYECDFTQILKSDSMVSAGKNFLELMKERNALLMDTELILGDSELGYTGAPDKIWLLENKEKTKPLFLITDYKSNKPKSFEVNQFTKKMKYPFSHLHDNALGHYYLQLPFYGKLLLKMLKGTEFEDISLGGGIIVHLKDDGKFEEYRVPKDVIDTIMGMDMKKYLIK